MSVGTGIPLEEVKAKGPPDPSWEVPAEVSFDHGETIAGRAVVSMHSAASLCSLRLDDTVWAGDQGTSQCVVTSNTRRAPSPRFGRNLQRMAARGFSRMSPLRREMPS